jgi:hypothetical protein
MITSKTGFDRFEQLAKNRIKRIKKRYLTGTGFYSLSNFSLNTIKAVIFPELSCEKVTGTEKRHFGSLLVIKVS